MNTEMPLYLVLTFVKVKMKTYIVSVRTISMISLKPVHEHINLIIVILLWKTTITRCVNALGRNRTRKSRRDDLIKCT
eukprot:UN27933